MLDDKPKRIILCCDGTWMDSDNGFTAPTLIPYVPTGSLQVPSNVTRIHRALSRRGPDGTHQIMYYHSGVGTGSTYIDTLTGGLLGTGISENIREVYAFLAINYSPGDEIILIGFSRGAFTARSIALMIREIGLLTPRGMYDFYAIFKDQENFRNEDYQDELPTIPFSHKPKPGPNAADEYRRRLEEAGLTRVHDDDGKKIKVKAVAVWDTVGSLGIPQLSILAKFGLPHSTKEYRFFDTKLSRDDIEHAFQALALDEHRKPFSPAVWERDSDNATDLRQVWFPGAHANIGGGYDDQEIANISMVWMMDQLASIGVSFEDWILDEMFLYNVKYYERPPKPSPWLFGPKPWKKWAIQSIYEKYAPIRPWGLGQIYNSLDGMFWLTGSIIRSPGLYKRPDPKTGLLTKVPMEFTHERIHSCVRTRLELEGLGPEDHSLYDCPALLESGPWQLKQKRLKHKDPIPRTASWGPGGSDVSGEEEEEELRWVWEYAGPEKDAPKNPEDRVLAEEPLGPYERYFQKLRKDKARSYNGKTVHIEGRVPGL